MEKVQQTFQKIRALGDFSLQTVEGKIIYCTQTELLNYIQILTHLKFALTEK
jgi:hypothetical protein